MTVGVHAFDRRTRLFCAGDPYKMVPYFCQPRVRLNMLKRGEVPPKFAGTSVGLGLLQDL